MIFFLLRTDHLLELGKYVNRAGLPWTAYDQELIVKPLSLSGTDVKGLEKKNRINWDQQNWNWWCTKNASPPLIFRDIQLFIFETLPFVYEVRSACFGDSGGGFIYKDSMIYKEKWFIKKKLWRKNSFHKKRSNWHPSSKYLARKVNDALVHWQFALLLCFPKSSVHWVHVEKAKGKITER